MHKQTRAVVALLAAAAWAVPAALAADSLSGLGEAFRPQGGGATSPTATTNNPDTNRAAQGGSGDGNSNSNSDSNGSTPGLRVVLVSPARNLATIDGQIVRLGDRVNGMRVTQINTQGVLLVGEDGARARLAIHPAAVKQARPAAHVASEASTASTASTAGSAKKGQGQ